MAPRFATKPGSGVLKQDIQSLGIHCLRSRESRCLRSGEISHPLAIVEVPSGAVLHIVRAEPVAGCGPRFQAKVYPCDKDPTPQLVGMFLGSSGFEASGQILRNYFSGFLPMMIFSHQSALKCCVESLGELVQLPRKFDSTYASLSLIIEEFMRLENTQDNQKNYFVL